MSSPVANANANANAKERWETEGWCVLEGLLPDDAVRAAETELLNLFPSAAGFAADRDPERNQPFRTDSHAVMPSFPFESAALNDLVLHDSLMDLAEDFLGLTDLRLYQGMLSAKYSGGALSDEQLLHVDYGNHTLVVPRPDVGYQHLELFVYLSDVSADTAATRLVSRGLTSEIPIERTYLSVGEYRHLYEAEMPAVGGAGSVLAYRPDVYHRGVRMTAPASARFMLHVSFKPAADGLARLPGLAGRRRGFGLASLRAGGHAAAALHAGLSTPGAPLLDRRDAAGGGGTLPASRPGALAASRLAVVPPSERSERTRARWWKSAVLYQIYPRSFADSNGDGMGDLPGIIEHLDHLEWLGVDGIWLSPITPSPNADWGYDVSDFCAVDPDFGTLDDLDRLIADAGRRGIRVLMDIVPNHTSDQHPWFLDSRSSRTAEKRDWYVWADPKPDGSPPNNWVSSFGGPAWTLDPPTGQYFLHNHLEEQPDLNWWNEDVRATFEGIMRFWFERGVAGFRIDVCNIDHQGRRASRQPGGHRGRRFRSADVRSALGLQRQPS